MFVKFIESLLLKFVVYKIFISIIYYYNVAALYQFFDYKI